MNWKAFGYAVLSSSIAILIVAIMVLSDDDSQFKCDVFTATVNNSGQETSKVSIQDDRFVDGTKVEVEICGESFRVKPLDK